MPRPSSCLALAAGLIASCALASAATINFTGSFLFDDDVAFFQFQSPTTGLVSVNTSHFAAGDFAPMLALYDASGMLILTVDGVANNDCSVAGPDIGLCYDAAFSNFTATAGANYYVALSQYDNLAIGNLPVTQ